MPKYKAVSDHASSGTVRGETYECEPDDVRVRAGILVEIPAPPAPKPKRKRKKVNA